MTVLEIPVFPVAPELVDPYYQDRFGLAQRAPSLPIIGLGTLANASVFSSEFSAGRAICDWPIGLHRPLEVSYSGDEPVATYAVPEAFDQFGEAISRIAAHEHGAYPGARHANIEIDARQSLVAADTAQIATREFHRDVVRGNWRHIYMVADEQPTEFLTFTDPTAEGFLYRDPNGSRGSEAAITPDPYEIVFANGTTFHRSPVFNVAAMRTFVRVTYTHDLEAAPR